MCEPAAFYVRSRDHLDVVTDDPDGCLPLLPDNLPAPEMVAYIFLIAPKTASVMLRWWYSDMNLSRSSLCVRVMSPQAWLPPFLQTVLDLGNIRGVHPRQTILSHSSLAK